VIAVNRKLVYLLVFLVVLAGVILPAVYSNKADSLQGKGVPVESEATSGGETSESASGDIQKEGQQDREIQPQDRESGTEEKVAAEKGQSSSNLKTGDRPKEGSSGAKSSPPSKDVSQSSPDSGCRVGVAVVGMDGELLFGPAYVVVKKDNKWGQTALGALEATGLPYTTKPFWPDFVESICGQSNQGTSGWMYMVNGEVPMHMADKHPVKDGDKVIWWYSRSMDQPPPRWDELGR
jgi:hypothetical protein